MLVVHVITSLGDGGAENSLFRLVTADASSNHEHLVISLMAGGKYGPLLRDQGVRVVELGMQRKISVFYAAVKLYRLLRSLEPDVLHCWMYHANLLAGAVGRLTGVHNVIWGVRHSELDPATSSPWTLRLVDFSALLSRWIPRRIVYVASSSRRAHEARGFDPSRGIVIPNGYDLDFFVPSVEARNNVRKELGLDPFQPVVGTVARWHPDKNHAGLITALAQVLKIHPDARILFVGPGMSSGNDELCALLESAGILDSSLLLGRRDDICDIMNALDVHVLASHTEAFPNVLAESMACGTPCVSTDVGDAREIVSDFGWISQSGQGPELASTILNALASIGSSEFLQRSAQGRAHILQNFGLSNLTRSYAEVWSGLTCTPRD